MTIYAPINLQTQVQPGKARDPFLDQQINKIQNAFNQVLAPQSVRSLVQSGAASVDDWWLLVDCTNTAVTVTLPLAANGLRALGVKKIDASGNAVTILPIGTDKVEGGASIMLGSQYNSVTLVPDGKSGWWEF